MIDSLISIANACWRYVTFLVLLWLAFFFGRTLQSGTTPLIERIARRGNPVLSAALCRYTRRLTAIWCVYFLIAAALTLAAHVGVRAFGVGVASVSALLFVGEYWLRLRLFPAESFPGLVQQVRDTASVWRLRREA